MRAFFLNQFIVIVIFFMIYYISPEGAGVSELALLEVIFNSSYILYEILKLYLKSRKRLEKLTFVTTLVIILTVAFTTYLLGRRISQHYEIERFEKVSVNITISLSFVIVLLGSAYLIVRKELENQISANELLKRAYLEKKLETIQNQIKPHFLYNTLNVLVMLIKIDPQSATELVLTLSDFYRKIFDTPKVWSLKEELDLCIDYLRIMKYRFGNRLEFAVPQNTSEYSNIQIPSLVVHTFVENAITHNISKHDTVGKIKIKVDKSENGLAIWIIDGKANEDIKNEKIVIKETSGSKLAEYKLKEFYGNNYALEMTKVKNPEKLDEYLKDMKEGFVVTINLRKGGESYESLYSRR